MNWEIIFSLKNSALVIFVLSLLPKIIRPMWKEMGKKKQ